MPEKCAIAVLSRSPLPGISVQNVTRSWNKSSRPRSGTDTEFLGPAQVEAAKLRRRFIAEVQILLYFRKGGGVGDIALYKKGAARPTGGAGCVAMLVGPDAPLAFEPGLRGNYVKHAYDLYKADLTSEYPIVDGQYSLQCYTEAVDACYMAYNSREETLKSKLSNHANVNDIHAEKEVPIDKFDYMCLYAPTCKLVFKSYARLLYNDFLSNPENPVFAEVPTSIKKLTYEQTIIDKTVEKTFMALAKKRFAARNHPSIQVFTMCGNMYCGSVYGSLVSLLANVSSADLQSKRIGIFSYGSGLAASMFSLKVRGSTEQFVSKVDLHTRLDARCTKAPEVYDEMCILREKTHLNSNFEPQGSIDTLLPGTYYLTKVDEMFRREYEIKQ